MNATGRMHSATTLTPILARVLAVLRAHPEGATTMQIIVEANACAINSHASALRRLGYAIECKPVRGVNGAKPHVYTLVERGQLELAVALQAVKDLVAARQRCR